LQLFEYLLIYKEEKYQYNPLLEPIPITKQEWPEGLSSMDKQLAKYKHSCEGGNFNACSTDGTREIAPEYEDNLTPIQRYLP
jgi:hypothetical protein